MDPISSASNRLTIGVADTTTGHDANERAFGKDSSSLVNSDALGLSGVLIRLAFASQVSLKSRPTFVQPDVAPHGTGLHVLKTPHKDIVGFRLADAKV